MANEESARRHCELASICIGSMFVAIFAAWFGMSVNDTLNGHIIGLEVSVLEQQQMAASCTTLVSLAPGINQTVIEAWDCSKSAYTPQKPAPVCHRRNHIQEFTLTAWKGEGEDRYPDCAGSKSTSDCLIASTVLVGFGVALIALGLISCCSASCKAARQVADSTALV